MYHQANYNSHQYYPPQQQQLRWMQNNPPQGLFHKRPNPRYQSNYQNNNEQHWCETCDRGFPSNYILENHKSQHQKCNIDGCQFVAHPKVITKHIQMQHSSGLFKKIANLKNPEEIKKWIEERKQKYPTKENVEKKTAELKAKIERGEKMGLRPDQRNNRFRTGPDNKRKQQFPNNINKNKRQKLADSKHPQTDKAASNITTLPNENILNRNKKKLQKRENMLPVFNNGKLKPFTGIKDLLDDFVDSGTTDENTNIPIEDDSDVEEQVIRSEPKICAALTSLICNYESDEETKPTLDVVSKSKPTEIVQEKKVTEVSLVNKIATQEQEQVSSRNEKYNEDVDSGPEEIKVEKVQIESLPLENNVKNIKPVKRHDLPQKNTRISNFRKSKPKIPSTLLRKLLHNEIKQERNIILQCIRHIIENNYFET